MENNEIISSGIIINPSNNKIGFSLLVYFSN
jgi:hypothetical protein